MHKTICHSLDQIMHTKFTQIPRKTLLKIIMHKEDHPYSHNKLSKYIIYIYIFEKNIYANNISSIYDRQLYQINICTTIIVGELGSVKALYMQKYSRKVLWSPQIPDYSANF